MNLLYRHIKQQQIAIAHACEVGVYLPETSNVIDFIREGIHTTLVEADPITVEKIKAAFGQFNITLQPVAVWESRGRIQLSRVGASTFVSALDSSPAIENDGYRPREEDSFEADSVLFSDIDDGTIDLLCVDIEGAEWHVLNHLKSHPKVIAIETHGKYYTNPHLADILQWMQERNYQPWYKDKSDTVFVRSDVYIPTFGERLALAWRNFRIALRRAKRYFRF